jgi:alpha-glucosidase
MKYFLCLLLGLQTFVAFAGNAVKSPDGNVVVGFVLQTDGSPAYRIDYRDKPIVLESRLGFEPDFTNGFQIIGAFTNSHAGQWTNALGERRIVPDNFRELNVDLKHTSGRWLRISFRAYDEGAAFRCELLKVGAPVSDPARTDGSSERAGSETGAPAPSAITFTGERTEFRFPENTFGYEEHGTEGEYRKVNTADMKPWGERPLTLEYANGVFASLAEAANQNYPRMLLSPLPGVSGALVSALGGTTANTDEFKQRHDPTVKLRAGDSTPWRTLVVGDKPGDLLERNYLMLNLNPPCALADTSWIKPGKAMRDMTLTVTNSKAIIDFAAAAGLRYVHLDAGWYGTEDIESGDATQARIGGRWVRNLAQPVDLPEIIRYAREKKLGVILYVDRRQIKTQRDILFPLYEKWGIAGVKIGFVDVGPQTETAWITETIQKAAGHHLMLNIHDGYRATGNNRTWPNLMTVEGIRGNEHMPTSEHNCTLPFTRYIAGPGDYTVCYYNNRIQTTHAHQLAMAVVSFSPLQWIFWYDKPADYHGEPEIEFFQHVPTVWDDTKVINGDIGKFATIARRSGENWFMGTINNSEPRGLKVPLAFLTGGKKYTARIYSDDESVATRTKVGIETRTVDSQTTLDVPLRAAGGQAIWITPAPKEQLSIR